MEYVKRITKIEKFINKRKSILILGPRGSGKSCYINHILKENNSFMEVNLLETDIFQKYLTNPSQLRKEIEYAIQKRDKLCVFIDEIQKIPALLDEIHLLIEKYKEKIYFILTGSSARKLKKSNANLLAGRAIVIPFYNFSFEEIDINQNLNDVLQYGLLPEVFLEEDPEFKIEILRTYTGTYLKEEIMQESLVRNVEGFSKFLELAAFNNSAQVNYSKLSKQINISDQSVKTHYQILEDTLIATKIPAWTFSLKKQLQQTCKYYFFDNGVLNALTGELKTELKEASFRYGKLFENFIVNEIIKYNDIYNFNYNIFHYKTNHSQEIDLILQKNSNSDPVAIEIKSSIMPNYKDVKNLEAILEDYPKAKCYCICRCKQAYKDKNITFLPFYEGIKEIFNGQ
ncbi:MAG: AAA family ATPase [Pseudomonadota bacterium]